MIRTILLLAALVLPCHTVTATPLSVGAKAPDVTAPDQSGQPVDFGSVYAKGITLIYFYPKSGTSGCTAEACSLRDSYEKLKAQGLQIIGVSRDGVEAQKKFTSENKLPFTIVADPDGKVSQAFGVDQMGLLPFDARESFIVKDGAIAWTSLHAKTKGSADEVQAALDGLKK
jgi:peroxiredoxin Q/BCP